MPNAGAARLAARRFGRGAAYVQLRLWYALLDVATTLKQQTAILELTQQRVSAGPGKHARVKQSEGSRGAGHRRRGGGCRPASTWRAISFADLAAAGPDPRPAPAAPAARGAGRLALPSALPRNLLAARPGRGRGGVRRWKPRLTGRAAEADFYPNVNLTAFCRPCKSIGLSQLFRGVDRIVGRGARRLHLPVFNAAGLRGALQTQQAQLDQSGRPVQIRRLLDAVREVADLVANWRGARAARAASSRSRSRPRSALRAHQRALCAGL